jgi:hypothetical protein
MCPLDVLKNEQIIISISPQIMSIASSLVALKIRVVDNDDDDHQNIYTKKNYLGQKLLFFFFINETNQQTNKQTRRCGPLKHQTTHTHTPFINL